MIRKFYNWTKDEPILCWTVLALLVGIGCAMINHAKLSPYLVGAGHGLLIGTLFFGLIDAILQRHENKNRKG